MSEASLQEAVPIRTVTERTGVNSVTLRAWERRYGLLKPMRTAKGHRLYQPEDIDRVHRIQQWLARGVAVGQVKALLDDPAAQPSGPDDVWGRHRDAMRRACHRLNRPALEQYLAQLGADYLPELLTDRCLEPLLTELRTEQEWGSDAYGSQTRLVFFEMVLRDWFGDLHRRRRDPVRGPRLLLLDSGSAPDPVLPVILAHTLSVQGYRVDCLGSIPAEEWYYAVDRLEVDALVLYSDRAPSGELELAMGRWRSHSPVPVWLAGRQLALLDRALADRSLGQSHRDIVRSLSTSTRHPSPPASGA